jgi:hypothetical protein
MGIWEDEFAKVIGTSQEGDGEGRQSHDCDELRVGGELVGFKSLVLEK